MTTQRQAEALLFGTPSTIKGKPEKAATDDRPTKLPDAAVILYVQNDDSPKEVTTTPTRRRVKPIYCPSCHSWVEILLQPVRLCCTGCGVEARP